MKPCPAAQLVCIPYEDLSGQTPQQVYQKLYEGFGREGLGILTISDVPRFAELRARLLPMAAQLASLPEATLTGLEDPKSNYNFGWARGQEALENGVADVNKGSFYANPLQDMQTDDLALLQSYPGFCRPNIWPSRDLPELREAFRELGQLIVQGRLLHYYPRTDDTATSGSWCGWHTDVSSFTGLTAAMYLRNGKEVPNPDPTAGLYIRAASGELVQARFPPGHLAFQMGEATQVQSDGFYRATPHFVRGARGQDADGVSRNTFAIFIQPRWDQPMTRRCDGHLEDPSGAFCAPGMTFGEYCERKFKQFSHTSEAALHQH